MSEDKSLELRKKIAQLKEEILIIKREVVDKELRREMLGERKGQLMKLEEDLKEMAEIERKEAEEKMLYELARKLKLEFMKAASIYRRVHYKDLASFIGCRSDYVLKIVDYLITSKELFATVEYPDIIFHRGPNYSEAPDDEKEIQEAPAAKSPTCLKCGNATQFIAQYNRYYCYQCKEYV